MGRLDGKVAVVVGSATGIGAATANLMAAEGARVLLADINAAKVEETADAIRRSGGEALSMAVDIAEEDQVDEMIATAVREFGGLDVLHNNAAALGPETLGPDSVGSIIDISLEAFDRTMAVNVRGFVLACRAALPRMLENGGGSIIQTASVAGMLAEGPRGAYGMSKAAVILMTKHLANFYGAKGIRCNAIMPGAVIQPTGPNATNTVAHEILLRHHPSPRLGRSEDIGHMAVFLASDDAEWVNGAIIPVDGGCTAPLPWSADMAEIEGRGR
jgi:NAD(P)-dependent dehydrogenase (short-subunit alcohol dehydrogenase family)